MVSHLVLALAFLTTSQPTPIPQTILQPAGLLQDANILEKTLKTIHPGLYSYNTPAQIDQAFSLLRKDWSKEQSLSSVYLRLSEFLAKIKCGHTYANFFNQSKEIAQEVFNKPALPFSFRWIDRKMVVTRDQSEEQLLPKGTIIESIDGVSTRTILDRLIKVSRADGSNDAKRIANLEVETPGSLEAFNVFYPLYFPSDAESVSLTIRIPEANNSQVIKIKKLPNGKQTEEPLSHSNEESPWTLTFPKSDVALLKMPTWVMYNRKWDWKTFLKNSFDQIISKSTPNMVIDLRGNEGGDSIGDVILTWLVKEKTSSVAFKRYTRYQKVPQELRANLSTWDDSFYDWGKAAQPDQNGMYKLTRLGDLVGNTIVPNTSRYLGKVFVLVGPENSSATFDFAYKMQSLKLGTLVGQPTGGSLRGINGGAFFFLKLPYSKIEVDVPIILQYFKDDRPDRSVRPDVLVAPTANDIAKGRDVEMERVFDLIRKPAP